MLDSADSEYMAGVIAALVRVRDAYIPELAVLVLLIVHTATSYQGLIDATPWLAHRVGAELQLTTAGMYTIIVTAPLFQFLLGLAFWKWLLWTYFVFKLSRQRLRLVATHPDEHGGLGFLGLTASAFAPTAFAASCVIGATWREEMLHHGARLMDFKFPALALVGIVALVALGPLLFLFPGWRHYEEKGFWNMGFSRRFTAPSFMISGSCIGQDTKANSWGRLKAAHWQISAIATRKLNK